MQAARVSGRQEEGTYWIERGKALYSSGDMVLSPARLGLAGSMAASFPPLRRRRLVTLCKSGVLLDFEDDDVVVVVDGVEGKQRSERRVAGKAARSLSLSVPAGPACCCCACAAASRKTIIIPCKLPLETGHEGRTLRRMFDPVSRNAAWARRGKGCSSSCGVTCRGEVEITLAWVWRAAAVGGVTASRCTCDESCMRACFDGSWIGTSVAPTSHH